MEVTTKLRGAAHAVHAFVTASTSRIEVVPLFDKLLTHLPTIIAMLFVHLSRQRRICRSLTLRVPAVRHQVIFLVVGKITFARSAAALTIAPCSEYGSCRSNRSQSIVTDGKDRRCPWGCRRTALLSLSSIKNVPILGSMRRT